MRCVVTGVAGFIGSTLADRLLAAGHEVVGIDCFVDYYPRKIKMLNLKQALQAKNFRLLEGSLLNIDLLQELQGAEWVFHQAAQAGVRGSWGKEFESYCTLNVTSTQRLLEALKGHATLKKLVYASSSSIYGDAECYPTPETALPAPVSPYGVTKLAAEHLVTLYAKQFGVPGVSLRYFTVYGPRQRPEMAFHRFVRAGIEGRSNQLFGTGEQSRDFTYVDDIVSANILAAERGPAAGVFNLGGGTQATMNQVLAIIQRELGVELKITREAAQKGDALHTGADSARARAELSFKPSVTLDEGIRRMIAWMRVRIEEEKSAL